VRTLPDRGEIAGGTLRILAHQDDDLLFQSRSLLKDVDDRSPMVTRYVTAGDDDDDEGYWRAREAGIRAAYAALVGVGDVWLDSTRDIDGVPVAQATLAAAPRVRLLFLRLPDGGVDGQGGERSGNSSLQRLWEGEIPSLTAVDGSATLTLAGLNGLLGSLVASVRPTRILTLDHTGGFDDGDHSDHHVVAYLAERAHASAPSGVSFTGFRGYPIRELPANLSAAEVLVKETAFFVYAQSDYKTCASVRECRIQPEALWLRREYEAVRVRA
jgi:LmbE family N-acetylglucosaminyl deacetylase